uniref:Nucleoside diphosphate kinase-like domain-containing protein n=1 Tax=Stomoxys calcitrans TaxID=35570 RepID=A0A1I8NVK7_STOCA
MFQDSLLIINSDFVSKRKRLLIFLLHGGFQIQGRRMIQFTPELAAEFYKDKSEDLDFMLHVILLSKAPSEALILSKENAVEDLIKTLVCYFGNSAEMEKFVHATCCLEKVQEEICFIFPNYIYEPIRCLGQHDFSCDNPLISSQIIKVYDLVGKPDTGPLKSWKRKLAEWLIHSNKDLPQVSNQCSKNPALNIHEMAEQTKGTALPYRQGDLQSKTKTSNSSVDFDSDGTSFSITTSSCVTCSGFSGREEYVQQQQSLTDIINSKTAPLSAINSTSSTTGVSQIDHDKVIVVVTEEMEEQKSEIIDDRETAVVDELGNLPDVNSNESKESAYTGSNQAYTTAPLATTNEEDIRVFRKSGYDNAGEALKTYKDIKVMNEVKHIIGEVNRDDNLGFKKSLQQENQEELFTDEGEQAYISPEQIADSVLAAEEESNALAIQEDIEQYSNENE